MSSRRHSSSLFLTFSVFSAIALLSLSSQVTQGGKAAPRAGASADRLIAPPRACPGQGRADAPIRVQEAAVRCLTNFARRRSGRRPLARERKLERSAELKSGDILRCDEFDHAACGRPFTHWISRTGYSGGGCWSAGENIAFGTGPLGTPRRIFIGWMRSTGHRRNILGRFEDLGVGLRIGRLGPHRGARVWTQHFGRRC